MSHALTPNIDVAQVVLYAFWIFFVGLIWWIRREDRREGYPLESDNPRRVNPPFGLIAQIPPPKTFLLPHGGSVESPNFVRDERAIDATRTSPASGDPLTPTGAPMSANAGPGSWAARHDEPELLSNGQDAIVPMRVATDYSILAGPDVRGFEVVGFDGATAGAVVDIWVDRADMLVRYLEVELSEGGRRLLPMPMALLDDDHRRVDVHAISGAQFAQVPTLKQGDRVTALEEERVSAYYAAGRLWATPRRAEPLL
jgi:photosynthetic reaction center H subunit